MRTREFRLWNGSKFINLKAITPFALDNPAMGGLYLPEETELLVIDESIGLKDRDGNDIYERDIFRETIEHDEGDTNLYAICVWIKEHAAFAMLGAGEYLAYQNEGAASFEPGMRYTYLMDEVDFKNRKRVGNLHQNPELIEP